MNDDGRDGYLTPEAKARMEIDRMLTAAGWVVTDRRSANPRAGLGVAVREFPLAAGHGQVDYLLFVDGRGVGVIEAKQAGTTLTGVEWQSSKYTAGVPDTVAALNRPLPFAYESTGIETRFTNGFDPEPASRRVFSFHRPEQLAEWCTAWSESPETATLRQRIMELGQEALLPRLEVSTEPGQLHEEPHHSSGTYPPTTSSPDSPPTAPTPPQPTTSTLQVDRTYRRLCYLAASI